MPRTGIIVPNDKEAHKCVQLNVFGKDKSQEEMKVVCAALSEKSRGDHQRHVSAQSCCVPFASEVRRQSLE